MLPYFHTSILSGRYISTELSLLLVKRIGGGTKTERKLGEKLRNIEATKTATVIEKSTIKESECAGKAQDMENLKEPQYSICSPAIPEYFCGEKFNTACKSCKADNDSQPADDPFSSFPTQNQLLR